jgi:hypothetical protein
MMAILTGVRFNVRPKTLKLLHENIWEMLEDISIDNCFLNRAPIAHDTITRIDKWDCIKLKSFCTSKERTTRIKR